MPPNLGNTACILFLLSFLRTVICVSSTSPPEEEIEEWQKSIMLEEFLQESNASKTRMLGIGGGQFDSSQCSLSPELLSEIQSYQQVVDRIIEVSTKGDFKGRTYDDLAYFVDEFGPRVSGSDALEKSITFLGEILADLEMDNVHEEEAVVPMWLR